MKYSVSFFAILLAIVFIACGPSDEDRARTKLNFAKVLLEKQDTTAALLQLDSILKLFPKAPYSLNAAKNLMAEVNFELLHRKEAMLDTMKNRIAVLENSFVKEKTEFDRFTRYIHKRQTFQRAWNRSFIQVHLDERGELYLSSNYHGKNPINHVGLRVYDGGDDAKTDSVPLGDPNNHQSDFMGFKWEKVTYRDGKDNGVIGFIANYADRKLKAVFLGKGQNYIILEEFDKLAVKDALALSKAIKSKNGLEKEIQILQKKLQIN
ncbi:MAG: hypothetical protein FD181_2560 [Prolixibacteraceae bacterium]|nr:MAG: hypothetical protein FD181_2560 [Prolixibacteraceae bacterium]